MVPTPVPKPVHWNGVVEPWLSQLSAPAPSENTARPAPRMLFVSAVVVLDTTVLVGAVTSSVVPTAELVKVPNRRLVAAPPLAVTVITPAPVTIKLPSVWVTVAPLRPIISKAPPPSVRAVPARKPLVNELAEVSRAILPPLMVVNPV